MLSAWTLAVALALGPVQDGGTPATVPDAEQVMAVPDELREEVRQRVVAPGGPRSAQLERLAALAFGDDGLTLEYDNERTRTVAEVYHDRKANCLSFSLLLVALAREAGLEAQIQEVGEVLTWYQDAGVVYNANHVNVGVRAGMQWQVIEMDTNILATRHRPRGIDDRRAMAHFHNNRGAELMAAGDPAAAQAFLLAALRDDPEFVPAWNNLGVLRLRDGDEPGAEHAYLTALRLNPEHAATLSNLVSLHRRKGDPHQVRHYAWRLDQVQNTDPFHQFMMALECEDKGDYDCAIARYRRAIRLQDGEHQFHFGLARAYFLSGDLGRAQRELGRAHTLSDEERVRSAYRRKLEHLRRWRQQASSQLRP